MRFRSFFLSLLLLVPVLAQAQSHFSVRLTDAADNGAIEDAMISVYSSNNDLIAQEPTDGHGEVKLTTPQLPVRLEIMAFGYEPHRQTIREVPTGGMLRIGLNKRNTTTLEETVVTGVSTPVKIQNALSQYRIINKAQIQLLGAATLADILPYQLNTNISEDPSLGSNIRMMGLGGDKVKILIDGLPVNGRESGNIDLGQINLNTAERVEIIQGPMSVVYGTDALGGVINVITRQSQQPLELSAHALYESVGKYNFDARAGIRLGKRHMISLGGGRNYFQGWYDRDTGSVKRNLWWKPKEQYLGNAAYSYTAPSGFRLQFASDYLNEKITNLGTATITPYFAKAQDEYYYDVRSMNRLSLSGNMKDSAHWQLQNGYAYYNRVRKVLFKDLVSLNETMAPQEDGQDTSRFDDLTFRGNYDNRWKKLSYTVGYDVNLEYGRSNKISSGKGQIGDYALYGYASYPLLHDRLKAQLGLRGAYNTMYQAPLIPAVNLLYTPFETLQLRASYAKGFRAPSLKEMYLEFIDNNHHILGNPDLRPEESDNFQVSASWQFYQKERTRAQLVFTGFYNNVFNQITLLNLHPDVLNNIDYTYGNFNRLQNLIGNLQAELLMDNWQLTAGYGYSHTFAMADVIDAYNVSELNGSLQYVAKRLRTSFNLFVRYNGKQPLFSADVGGDATYNGMMPAYTMLDFSVSRRFWKDQLQVIMGIRNLLNVQILTPTGGAAPGNLLASAHGGNGATLYLPRRFFCNLIYNFR